MNHESMLCNYFSTLGFQNVILTKNTNSNLEIKFTPVDFEDALKKLKFLLRTSMSFNQLTWTDNNDVLTVNFNFSTEEYVLVINAVEGVIKISQG
jgi:hypothetical protein